MASYESLKVTLPAECSRIEQLAFLGTLSPQVLTSDEVRELSLSVSDYIKAKKERATVAS